jgi:hypothetical protein
MHFIHLINYWFCRSLLVYWRKENTFTHFDSLNNSNERTAQLVAKNFEITLNAVNAGLID